MQKIIDKHLLLAVSLVFLFGNIKSNANVFALLISIFTIEVSLLLNTSKSKYCLTVLFLIGCFLLPELTFFLPILIYDFVEEKNWTGYIYLAVFFVNLSVYTKPWQIYLWFAMIILTTVFALRTKKQVSEHQQLLEIRDDSVEQKYVMQQKNKELLEKQDYEINMATLSERNRIAREIHDNVGHMLSRTILQIGALMMVHKDNELIHEQLSSVNESLNEAMNNIRESVHDLHNEAIDLNISIKEAIRPLEEKCQADYEYDMSKDVPRNVKYCMIAIIKEATANIIKHSNATKVEIMLREHPGFYQLLIEDNGTKMKDKNSEGIGLSNMRERVEALSGSFHYSDEKGFRIMISIPKEGKKE